jgi:type III secretion protein Q
MTAQQSPLRSLLQAVEPARTHCQNAIIAALNRRETGPMTIATGIVHARERRAEAVWIRFETAQGEVSIAPILADGKRVRMTTGGGDIDGILAAAALADIEPLVAAMEALLMLELRPIGTTRTIPDDQIMLRIDGLDSTGIRHRLIAAFPETIAIVPNAPPTASLLKLSAFELLWQAHVNGPSIAADRLASVRAGDLIVLGTGPLVAQVAPIGLGKIHRGLLASSGAITIMQTSPYQPEADQVDRRTGLDKKKKSSGSELQDVRLPIRMEIDGIPVSIAELALLGPGSTLQVPAVGGVLQVRLFAGQTAFGTGEIVAIGDGYGVMIDKINGAAE